MAFVEQHLGWHKKSQKAKFRIRSAELLTLWSDSPSSFLSFLTVKKLTYQYYAPLTQASEVDALQVSCEKFELQSQRKRNRQHVKGTGRTEIPKPLAQWRVILALGYECVQNCDTFFIFEPLSKENIDEIILQSQPRALETPLIVPTNGLSLDIFAVVVTYSSLPKNLDLHRLDEETPRNEHEDATSQSGKLKSNTAPSTQRQLDQILDEETESLQDLEYCSAKSHKSTTSKTTYYTAPPIPGSVSVPQQLTHASQYAQILEEKRLWPVDPSLEQNWSGRGQHAEFKKFERDLIDSLLKVEDILARTRNATVESVKCRRILLARKTILCDRHFSKEQVVEEVSHLARLEHSHILRVIGTYVLGRQLSILLYPVADYNLEEFMEVIQNGPSRQRESWMKMVGNARYFFACLSGALQYIHGKLIKHMDIKPQNILVRKRESPDGMSYKVYIADFGIARAYKQESDVETDRPTQFTRKYASPEVVNQDTRGFPADIFSLGCVFLELFATLHDAQLIGAAIIFATSSAQDKHARTIAYHAISGNFVNSLKSQIQVGNTKSASYQANIKPLRDLIDTNRENLRKISLWSEDGLKTIQRMISENPLLRPYAADAASFWFEWKAEAFSSLKYVAPIPSCCTSGREELEAYITEDQEDERENEEHKNGEGD